MMNGGERGVRSGHPWGGRAGAILLLLAGAISLGAAAARGEAATIKVGDNCVRCHSNPDFLVRNKKLYDYFQAWKLSIHSQEGVTCVECHGGNSKAPDKASAHAGRPMGSEAAASPINYRNIPRTCARCHKAVYARFRQSTHFKHLKEDGDQQAPTCVTCHGSVNIAVLNVRSVGGTCRNCHNQDSGNRPDIPQKAEEVLNHFLSIHRYYRYIALRGAPEDIRSFFRLVDPMIEQLNADWHSFNIDRVDQQTHDLVNLLKVKRNQIKSEQKKTR